MVNIRNIKWSKIFLTHLNSSKYNEYLKKKSLLIICQMNKFIFLKRNVYMYN